VALYWLWMEALTYVVYFWRASTIGSVDTAAISLDSRGYRDIPGTPTSTASNESSLDELTRP
jgi:hypothetical protein